MFFYFIMKYTVHLPNYIPTFFEFKMYLLNRTEYSLCRKPMPFYTYRALTGCRLLILPITSLQRDNCQRMPTHFSTCQVDWFHCLMSLARSPQGRGYFFRDCYFQKIFWKVFPAGEQLSPFDRWRHSGHSGRPCARRSGPNAFDEITPTHQHNPFLKSMFCVTVTMVYI